MTESLDIDTLVREHFPNGDPHFYQLLLEEASLHNAKNYDYAHGGDPLGNFIRCGKILALYPGLDLSHPAVYAATLLLKQLDAALWMMAQGHESQTGEGVDARWRDVGVYAKLVQCLLHRVNRPWPRASNIIATPLAGQASEATCDEALRP